VHRTVKGFQISIGDDLCWRTLVLKKQNKLVNEKLFPQTSSLLDDPLIHNAMFSILYANVNIPPHTGYYKGYLRYHLGIIIPKDEEQRPFIICGDQKYYWNEGEGVLFDDMYLHYVENPTKYQRVVLYIDVLRTNVPEIIQPIYDFFTHILKITIY
jgi:beta-hydroxylase